MSVKRVVVEIEFRIEGENLAVFGDDQRIDFNHRAIATDESPIQCVEQFGRTARLRMLKPKLFRELARLKRLQPGKKIDRFANNFLRRLCGDALDVDAALRASHNQWRRSWTIADDRKI